MKERFMFRAPPGVCQSCIHRVKFNRRSGCKVKGVETTINCLDKACEHYDNVHEPEGTT